MGASSVKPTGRFSGVRGANYIELPRPQHVDSNLFTELTSAAACSVLVRFRMPLADGRCYGSVEDTHCTDQCKGVNAKMSSYCATPKSQASVNV
jgi:hypothetical protein